MKVVYVGIRYGDIDYEPIIAGNEESIEDLFLMEDEHAFRYLHNIRKDEIRIRESDQRAYKKSELDSLIPYFVDGKEYRIETKAVNNNSDFKITLIYRTVFDDIIYNIWNQIKDISEEDQNSRAKQLIHKYVLEEKIKHVNRILPFKQSKEQIKKIISEYELETYKPKFMNPVNNLEEEVDIYLNVSVFQDAEKLKQYIDTRPELTAFLKMKSGTFNHELAKLNKKRGEADYDVKVYRNPRFTMRVAQSVGGKFLPTTQRLLNVLLSNNTVQGDSPEFTLNISNFMELCGLKDRQSAMELLAKDAQILFHTWFEIRATGSKGQMRVIEKWEKTKDTVSIKMAPSFWNIYKNYSVSPISKKSLAISLKIHPNSQHFSFKITQHKAMNYGKQNADIISVKTLLEGSEIPSYDEVLASDRHISERIINPFERDLDALNEDFTWEYCRQNGTPLAEEELVGFVYDVFITLNIKISWNNFPDQTKRLEKKNQHIEKAIKKPPKKRKNTSKKNGN